MEGNIGNLHRDEDRNENERLAGGRELKIDRQRLVVFLLALAIALVAGGVLTGDFMLVAVLLHPMAMLSLRFE